LGSKIKLGKFICHPNLVPVRPREKELDLRRIASLILEGLQGIVLAVEMETMSKFIDVLMADLSARVLPSLLSQENQSLGGN